MLILYAALGGFVLDLLFGDPAWLPHPVVAMGRYIERFERFIRARLPGTPVGERLGGMLLALSLPLLTLAVTLSACLLARRIHWGAELALQTFWCWQALAAHGLAAESRRVYAALKDGDLPAARAAVAHIVGRDTARLDAEGVAKAAVETVAENFSDGVAAPMLCMFLGGAPLSMMYKSINTMDSMVGYTNEKYLNFGRIPARLDDAANYLPSRIAALFLILAAALTGQDAGAAYRIWRRDALKHLSPNAGQTEAACAGALGVQLGGDAWYFGERHEKALLGDAIRSCGPEDILKTDRMMYCGSVLLCLFCAAVRLVIVRRG
ncbi:MAG: cobalamin biosynthesis protein CobD [Oscillospiraceae bacterium]|nr:cobalamin biosynthesis protein CobD [Oscillospiraceae bacterium]